MRTAASIPPTSMTALGGPAPNRVVRSERTSKPNSVSDTSSNKPGERTHSEKPCRHWQGFSFAPCRLQPQLVQMALRLELDHCGNTWSACGSPTDLSIPVNPVSGMPRAWYRGPALATPVRSDGWTGSVAEGGSVNFRDITFNPHAHGTHTETREHIHDAFQPIDALARAQGIPFIQPAYLFNALPDSIHDDWVVSKPSNLDQVLDKWKPSAVILRCTKGDVMRDWSDSNPPYLESGLAEALAKSEVRHLLIDLPSVDREVDGGVLRAHHAFFGSDIAPRVGCTISELLCIPESLESGPGLLAMQVSPFINDAAPSRPLWFPAEITATTS